VGKGISFCATCDGLFYRKKRLAVIGLGDYDAFLKKNEIIWSIKKGSRERRSDP